LGQGAVDLTELVGIVRRLRAPGGCPWDRAQTHESLAPYALEEAREVAAAIADGDRAGLAAELGDLLLQVLMHAAIAEEEGTFDLQAVVDGLAAKLVRRHPHVFGAEAPAATPADVERLWAAVKAQEAAEASAAAPPDAGRGPWLDTVSRSLPAVAESQALGKRASQVGFDWSQPEGAWPKVEEECGEFRAAWAEWAAAGSLAQGAPRAAMAAELGDLLFAVANVARLLGIDAESALAGTNERFRRRFGRVQQLVGPDPEALRRAGLTAMDAAWDRAKAEERADPPPAPPRP
jgi:MazG family protein